MNTIRMNLGNTQPLSTHSPFIRLFLAFSIGSYVLFVEFDSLSALAGCLFRNLSLEICFDLDIKMPQIESNQFLFNKTAARLALNFCGWYFSTVSSNFFPMTRKFLAVSVYIMLARTANFHSSYDTKILNYGNSQSKLVL